MEYYNRLGERLKLNIGELSYLNRGNCAKVFHNDTVVLKRYFGWTEDFYRLEPKIFDLLKSINSPHMVEIFDIYTSDFLSRDEKCEQDFRTDVYTSKYYKDNECNPLFQNTDYILDNFRELETLFNKLSDSSVWLDDIKRENSILSSNSIILIDPDSFHFSDCSKESILINNKQHLLFLFHSICSCGLTELPMELLKTTHAYKKLDNLKYKIKINENTDVTYEISKSLQKVKRPVDYFTRKS